MRWGAWMAGLVTGAALAAGEIDDPYAWLEDVTSERSLAWVRDRNATTVARLEADPGFTALRDDLREILDSDARIPMIGKTGAWYYNFWKDAEHERGVWRRTTMDEYRKASPAWETVLDLDALAKAEGEPWVWHGADCLRPTYTRCLISLSRGGADAEVLREYDLETRTFVKGGFELPEAKGGAAWKDIDTLYVFTDFGAGTMTTSGYPRTVREWKRGTRLERARVVYEGRDDDMYISAWRDDTPGFERDFVQRTVGFYENELFLRAPDGELHKVPAPDDAVKSVHRQWLLLELRSDWTYAGDRYAAGSLLATTFECFMKGDCAVEVLFEPTPTSSLASFSWTRKHLLLNTMVDVKNQIEVLTPGRKGWKREPLVGAPPVGTLSAWGVDDEHTDDYFMTVTDYLTPPRLLLGRVGREPELLKQQPAFFDASGMEITQHFATSDDGARIPYFQVAPAGMKLDGGHPTLLYGYGGFEISLTPSYSASVGRGWLSRGHVYVVANIRGGGEYGPAWHQAALKENRHKAYEDFAAVARDLVSRGVTRKERLGIQGGSNGGLLMGNMFTRYPDLFEAVVCQVPLLDMKRYSHLLAGASWMGEYGDPDDPAQWQFIQTFSPYHNVKQSVDYPTVLFTTSTRDDRVHPGHARKMMARMMEQGHDVWYYENIEGGHGGAANNKQAAFMQALAYTFLDQELDPP
ncbi:MAG TPA: prolyl oligopeptidase family serine peptidase [Myxococcota bacterium]|nr:prolyl oligopeptidase family serine peptidase [Myxococcota bacterium]